MVWDATKADKSIHEWASDANGKPIKDKAKQCYMIIEDKGTEWANYRYPVVDIIKDKPETSDEGTQAAWDLAVKNDPGILKNIIGVRKAAKLKLTDAMNKWSSQNMKSQSIDDSRPGIISEDDTSIVVEGPLFRDGVFNGSLQTFDDFLTDVDRMKGLPYVRGEHPRDAAGRLRPVNDNDDIIGTIIDARAVPDKKLILGTWKISKALLSQGELDGLHRGDPVGTSPGFWCDEVLENKPKVYIPTGELYYRTQVGPRIFDHVASPRMPACKKCGPFHAQHNKGGTQEMEKPNDGNQVASERMDVPKLIAQGLWSDEELKKLITDVLALDSMMVDKRSAMEKLLVQILAGLDAAPLKIQSQGSNMDLKMLFQSQEFKDVMAATDAKIDQANVTIELQKKELDSLKSEKDARDAAAANEQAQKEKDLFISWLKPGSEARADELYKLAKDSGNLYKYRVENPDMFVAQSQQSIRFMPSGAEKVPGRSGSTRKAENGLIIHAETGDPAWDEMGIKSPERLGQELGLLPPEKKK